MYVDEKRHGEVQTASKAGMAAWIIANKDLNETYDWLCSNSCPCAQYAASIGTMFVLGDPIWTKLNRIAEPHPFAATTDTYGNLLERLRAAL